MSRLTAGALTPKVVRLACTIWPCVGAWLSMSLPRDAMAQGPPVSLVQRWSLGALDGDDRLEFGNIEDIAISEDGNYVFALDRLKHRLTAISRSGAIIGSAGRDGGGPGEFRYPSAVIAADSVALVVDAALGRMSSWVVRGNSLVLKQELSSTVFLETRDACALGGSIVLLRLWDGRIIQRVAPDGAVVRAFGAPFATERHPVMAAATTFGYVACDSRSGSVYVAGSYVPVVRRYRENGDLLWETSVPGIHPYVIKPVGAGIQYQRPEGREHPQFVVSLVPLSDSTLVIQFGDAGPGIAQPSDITDVVTVLMSADDGSVLWQGTGLPKLDLARGNDVYSHPSDPFPHVQRYEWRKR